MSSTDYTYDILITYADGTIATFTGYNFKSFTSGGALYAYLENGAPMLSTSKPAAAADTTAASKALTARYNKSVTRYNALVDQIDKLDAASSFVEDINQVATAINAMGKVIGEGSGVYLQTQIDGYNSDLDALDRLMNQLDTLVAQAQVQTPQSITANIFIKNNTSVDLVAIWMSPSSQSNWGDNLCTIKQGQSGKTSVTFSADALVWDLQVQDAVGDSITFTGIDFSNCSTSGGTITLTYDANTQAGTATPSW